MKLSRAHSSHKRQGESFEEFGQWVVSCNSTRPVNVSDHQFASQQEHEQQKRPQCSVVDVGLGLGRKGPEFFEKSWVFFLQSHKKGVGGKFGVGNPSAKVFGRITAREQSSLS